MIATAVWTDGPGDRVLSVNQYDPDLPLAALWLPLLLAQIPDTVAERSRVRRVTTTNGMDLCLQTLCRQ